MISARSFACAVGALGAVIVFSDDSDARPGKARSADVHEQTASRESRATLRLDDEHRRIAREYYASDCPPGLAKKRNGCQPPGQAKKSYTVGRRLPDGYYGDVLPDDLLVRLPRLPGGYGYRLLDGDLGVIELSTLIVLDAIGLY